ncbi:spermidine/putrescine-binding protein [Mucilaginibacter sp. UYP25]|uniref:DUF6520 family protein n=1 Tax=unclassified Mucilaginibacter TaxID=2617802 RepID=UPI00339731BA
MKKSKAFIFSMAILLGVAGAFTTTAAKSAKKFAGVNWSFTGTPSQINDASKYTYSATQPVCSGSTSRCSVVAERSTSNPMQPNLNTITAEVLKN